MRFSAKYALALTLAGVALISVVLINFHNSRHLKHEVKVNISATGIPSIIHQTWRTADIATVFAPYVLSWKRFHPNWLYRFWTNTDISHMVRNNFPHLETMFFKYPKDIQKADVMRYMLLYHYGGVYSDIDVECLRPLDDIINKYPCIFAQDLPLHYPRWPNGFITNALMICRPGHPFMKNILDNLNSYFEKHGDDVLWTTGPNMLEIVLKEYLNVTLIPDRYHGIYLKEAELYLAPWQMFLPTFDLTGTSTFPRFCSETLDSYEKEINRPLKILNKKSLPGLIQQCMYFVSNGWINAPVKESYTDHHWVHTWNKENNKKFKHWKDTVNVNDLV